MTESEHPERWRAIAFTGVRAALASEWQSFRPDVRVPAHDVVVSGRSLEFGDAEAYRRAYPDLADAIDASGMRGQSFLVPLTAGSRCLGTLTLSYRERVDDAQAKSTRLTLQELAPVIGHSVSQAQFLELEARIASSFQEAMLELRREPDPRLDVATFYLAGSVLLEAGGDWYDVIDLPDGRIALTIGDVVGRSLRAATVMGRLRTAMRGLVLALQDPAEVLVALDALVDTIEDAPFSTCSCIVVDPSARQLTYANAGHPPALHVSERGEGVFLEAAQGPPLGVHGRQPRRSARHPFEVGGRLVLYTDGLVERRKEPLDLGLARLHDAVVRADGTMMENLPGAVARALFAEYEQRDDVAMICAELISESADRFHRVVEPDPMAIRTVRRRFGYWIGAGGADHKAAQDAVLALGEALANAVEHGGATRHSIEVEAVRRGELLELAVRDQGRWRDAEVDPSRGRGLQIMRHVADRVDIEAHESGTTVTLALPFGAPRAG